MLQCSASRSKYLSRFLVGDASTTRRIHTHTLQHQNFDNRPSDISRESQTGTEFSLSFFWDGVPRTRCAPATQRDHAAHVKVNWAYALRLKATCDALVDPASKGRLQEYTTHLRDSGGSKTCTSSNRSGIIDRPSLFIASMTQKSHVPTAHTGSQHRTYPQPEHPEQHTKWPFSPLQSTTQGFSLQIPHTQDDCSYRFKSNHDSTSGAGIHAHHTRKGERRK